MSATAGERALEALTVLDLSQGVAGPYAAGLFARNGARVITVEPPGSGDWTRLRTLSAAAAEDDASLFARLNGGKLSLTLDYQMADGAATLARLAEDADCLIEDLPTRRRQDLGLDADALLRRVPRLVICQVSGTRDLRGSATLFRQDVYAELLAGLHVFAVALAALWRAAQTEHGQVAGVDLGRVLPTTVAASGPEAAAQAAIDPSQDLYRMSLTPLLAGPAPRLGEHTDQVLDEIGWEAAAIEAMRARGIV